MVDVFSGLRGILAIAPITDVYIGLGGILVIALIVLVVLRVNRKDAKDIYDEPEQHDDLAESPHTHTLT